MDQSRPGGILRSLFSSLASTPSSSSSSSLSSLSSTPPPSSSSSPSSSSPHSLLFPTLFLLILANHPTQAFIAPPSTDPTVSQAVSPSEGPQKEPHGENLPQRVEDLLTVRLELEPPSPIQHKAGRHIRPRGRGARSCYHVRNRFCCQEGQFLCQHRLLCHDGKSFIRMRDDCAEPVAVPPPAQGGSTEDALPAGRSWLPAGTYWAGRFGSSQSVEQATKTGASAAASASGGSGSGNSNATLYPIHCSSGRQFKAADVALRKENKPWWVPAQRGASWLRRLRGPVAFWPGHTFLLFLGDSEGNVAHFMRKANHLLLLNNATVEIGHTAMSAMTSASSPSAYWGQYGFPHRVERVVLVRTPAFHKALKHGGPSGLQATMLASHLIMALKPIAAAADNDSTTLPELLQQIAAGLLGDEPLLDGRVHFESTLTNASEDKPVCFEHGVMTGNLKASAYPGEVAMAASVQAHLVHAMQITSGSERSSSSSGGGSSRSRVEEGTTRVLYIKRTRSPSKLRAFTNDSEVAFRRVLDSAGFNAVDEVDFGGIPFSAQVQMVQAADVIIGLHGAGLTVACSLARPGSVVIEVQPYKLQHIIFEGMAVTSGVAYIQHQCRVGRLLQSDHLFAHLGRQKCRRHHACHEYFVQSRPVELESEDLSSLGMLLDLARRVVIIGRGKTEHVVEQLDTMYRSSCIELESDTDNVCRVSFMRTPQYKSDFRCILSKDDCR